MKKTSFLVLICVIAAVIIAGCASTQPTPQPVPAPQTTAAIEPAPLASAAPPAPTQLAGSTWVMTQMGIQGGTAVIRPDSTEITLTFSPVGTLAGNGGCNNYNGPYTLSGETTSKGKGISVGPLISTKMFCQAYSDQETMYLNILQKAMAYNLDGNQLSVTATTGDVLIYKNSGSLIAQV